MSVIFVGGKFLWHQRQKLGASEMLQQQHAMTEVCDAADAMCVRCRRRAFSCHRGRQTVCCRHSRLMNGWEWSTGLAK